MRRTVDSIISTWSARLQSGPNGEVMSNQPQDKNIKPDLSKLKALFGPPPVLSSESEERYYDIMSRMMTCLSPRDFTEHLLVKDIVDATWEMMRLARHKTLAIERKLRIQIAFQARRRESQKEQREEFKRILSGQKGTEVERASDLVDVIDHTVMDVEKILGRTPQELDHAAALQESIDYQEQLDGPYIEAMARRNDTLEQLERYRDNLGQAASWISDELIDAEYSVVAPVVQNEVPLAPTGPGAE
jgi:hypothetical protein